MNSLPLLEDMRQLSSHMVDAARANDWDRLVSLEQNVSALRSRIADNDEPAATPAERARKIELMRQILADDAEVRRHVEPWMQQVKVFLGKMPAGKAGNT
ncbi:MAG: flagellar protein FliT [Gammaproteobacteria bacterium]|jgi:flagellar protein FliT|nr:flagellar protein FliT [Gammaproteobacteria bacterium]MBU0770269.1 flagellar protein FliT [Gammaproteobacteria bacterium]MBU1846303.1 flagellar protein FliT [Gammaproteobacteria bacterium]